MGLAAPFFSASPIEGQVGPKVRVGGTGAAFSVAQDLRNQTPHPALRADLPLNGGGAWCIILVWGNAE
jgi:hypothetical protein